MSRPFGFFFRSVEFSSTTSIFTAILDFPFFSNAFRGLIYEIGCCGGSDRQWEAHDDCVGRNGC